MRITWSHVAEADLDDLYDYIALQRRHPDFDAARARRRPAGSRRFVLSVSIQVSVALAVCPRAALG